MNDNELEAHRIAGEISLVLENGSQEERESILRLMLQFRPRKEVEETRDSYGIYYELP